MLAVWDDHDYGINDGSSDFSLKDESQQLFLDFFDEPADSERRKTPGIYDVKTFGPEGNRVQIILLDTRYFRTPPLPDTRSDEEKKALNIAGRYAPNDDPMATVLGETQWRWLEEQFRQPAELRLLVSSYPLVPTELGRDAWGNFPLERKRLFDLIKETKANEIIILSGDVHFAEISRTEEGPYPLYDFTSSALAAPSAGNDIFVNRFRISTTYKEVNFGLIEIDWQAQPAPLVTLKVIALNGSSVFEQQISLAELHPGSSINNQMMAVCIEPRPKICTMDYRTVCARMHDGSNKEYSNGCTSCSDPSVYGYYDETCTKKHEVKNPKEVQYVDGIK
jgi:alkaline phosphatase D